MKVVLLLGAATLVGRARATITAMIVALSSRDYYQGPIDKHLERVEGERECVGRGFGPASVKTTAKNV
jgi:hypothetical protein